MDNFVVGENLELVTFLRSPKAEFRGIWISGPRSSGRTHLLQAYCRAALQSGRQGIYLDCADLAVGASAQIQRAVNLASASDALVVLDNLGELQHDPPHEEALMLIYQSLYAVAGEMLVCHDQSARGVEFDLPDLNSRMRGFAHFALVPLRDARGAWDLGVLVFGGRDFHAESGTHKGRDDGVLFSLLSDDDRRHAPPPSP